MVAKTVYHTPAPPPPMPPPILEYAAFEYNYRHGLNNTLVLLIGGIHIAVPAAWSVTLAVGAQQLAQHKAIVTHTAAIEKLDTFTTQKLTIDKATVRACGPFSADDVILLAAYASRTESQDAIDTFVVAALGDPFRARAVSNSWTPSLSTLSTSTRNRPNAQCPPHHGAGMSRLAGFGAIRN